MLRSVKVWDIQTRLFTLFAAIFFVICLITAAKPGFFLTLHLVSGFGFFTLIIFRLIWGIVGGKTARFYHMLAGPGKIFKQLRNFFSGNQETKQRWAGHSPLAGWVAFLVLLAGLVIGLTGLLSLSSIQHATLHGFLSYLTAFVVVVFFAFSLIAALSSSRTFWLHRITGYQWLFEKTPDVKTPGRTVTAMSLALALLMSAMVAQEVTHSSPSARGLIAAAEKAASIIPAAGDELDVEKGKLTVPVIQKSFVTE